MLLSKTKPVGVRTSHGLGRTIQPGNGHVTQGWSHLTIQLGPHRQVPALPDCHRRIDGIARRRSEWEIIRSGPPSSEGEPFARTLLLRRLNTGRLRGFAFYDGSWAQLEGFDSEFSEATRDSMLRLTWNVAQRLRQAYGQHIAPIAKSLDDGSAEVTRPDLADACPDYPTRKP
jgi:hypothetical protein